MARKNSSRITQKWFDGWSNEYDLTLGSLEFHRELLDLVVRNSAVKSGDNVLDIGCGTGLLSLKFLNKAACSITAVDNSKQMLALFGDKIKKLKLGSRVVCKLTDAGSVRFPRNTFDIAASTVTLHHLKNKLVPVKKILEVLKPGGRLIIGEIDMDTTGKFTDIKRFRRVIEILEQEWISALKDGNVKAFVKMFDNGKKHILNDGEFCVSLRQWAALCRKAGFRQVAVKRVPRHKCFGVVVAQK